MFTYYVQTGLGREPLTPSLIAIPGATSGIASTVVQFALASGHSAVGVCYRQTLDAVPGAQQVPFEAHVQAHSLAIGVLVVLALTTSVLCTLTSRRRASMAAMTA